MVDCSVSRIVAINKNNKYLVYMTKKIKSAKLTNSAIFYRNGVLNNKYNFGLLVSTNYRVQKRITPENNGYVNLGIFFPPVGNQGESPACQSYATIYYLANYYQMLISFGLQPTRWQYFNNFIDMIRNYYSYDTGSNSPVENTVNPLYTYLSVTGDCKADYSSSFVPVEGWNFPSGQAEVVDDFYSASIIGCATYSNFNLNYVGPLIDKSTSKFIGCPPSQNLGPNVYPFLPNSNPVVLIDTSVYQQFQKSFNLKLVQSYLNNGLPLIMALGLPKYFIDIYVTYNSLSNFYPSLTTSGIWYYNKSQETACTTQVGGHTMCLCGYINNVKAAYEADGSSGVFIFINQWKRKFGNYGYGYITYNYFFNCFNPGGPLFNGNSPLQRVYYFPINLKI